jgi:hypothetical protein
MKQNSLTLPFPNVRLTSVALIDNVWVVWAAKIGTAAACPRCQAVSSARHSSYQRQFGDLPIQGRPVRIKLTVGRWQCRNANCGQSIFTDRLPGMAPPRSRQTWRAPGILRLLGHSVGGQLGERLHRDVDRPSLRTPKKAIANCVQFGRNTATLSPFRMP